MKNKRQEAILSIIDEIPVSTQEKLCDILNERGFNVTQATVSRDIKDLNLTKVVYNGNMHRYVVEKNEIAHSHNSYKQVLKNSMVSMDHSENIIVIKTVSGMAMAVGAALDNLTLDGIMGCIAGDDTLFLAIKHKEQAAGIMNSIREAAYNH